MATFDINSKHRYPIAIGDNPATIVYREATQDEIEDYEARRDEALANRKNRTVEIEDRKAVMRLQMAFALGLITDVNGVQATNETGSRDLYWPDDKETILSLIPRGLMVRYRDRVLAMAWPSETSDYYKAISGPN